MKWIECAHCGLEDPIEETNTDPYECNSCGSAEYKVAECACAAHCVICGCGDTHACAGSCWWVENPLNCGPLCSSCLPRAEQLQLDLAVLEALGLIERALEADEIRWKPAVTS